MSQAVGKNSETGCPEKFYRSTTAVATMLMENGTTVSRDLHPG